MRWPELGDTAYVGARKRVVFLRAVSGEQLAQMFLHGLDQRLRAKMAALFTLIGDQGRIANNQKFKKVECSDNIWEFKHFQTRVLCFMGSEQSIVLVNGEMKKTDKLTPALVKQAEQLRRSYLEGVEAARKAKRA